uniref:Uncharacterized protein n=1 Tax=Fagus sylvatica TaxID=28930 RepID=A0A2N9F120_FAGSY
MKIPVKRGMLSANREFHVVAGVVIFPTHPGLADQLVASRKDSAREGGCSGFAGIRAWACEIWPREQRPPGVFLVRLRDSFPIGIPARPGKFLAIREFHVVHGCVFFPTCPGLRINLLRVRKTLRASVATSLPMSDFGDLDIVGKLMLPIFQRYRPCTEASLGSRDMILANGGRWNVPYAKGSSSD